MLDESLQIDTDAEQRGQEHPKPRRGRKPKAAPVPRKPREKKGYEIQFAHEVNSVTTWIPVIIFHPKDTSEGLKWIAESGDDCKRYRVVCIMAEKTVKVETREVRTLE